MAKTRTVNVEFSNSSSFAHQHLHLSYMIALDDVREQADAQGADLIGAAVDQALRTDPQFESLRVMREEVRLAQERVRDATGALDGLRQRRAEVIAKPRPGLTVALEDIDAQIAAAEGRLAHYERAVQLLQEPLAAAKQRAVEAQARAAGAVRVAQVRTLSAALPGLREAARDAAAAELVNLAAAMVALDRLQAGYADLERLARQKIEA